MPLLDETPFCEFVYVMPNAKQGPDNKEGSGDIDGEEAESVESAAKGTHEDGEVNSEEPECCQHQAMIVEEVRGGDEGRGLVNEAVEGLHEV